MSAYFAIVHKDTDSAFGVSFPDLPGIFSAADEQEDIIGNATQALRLWAEDSDLPEASSVETLLKRKDIKRDLASGAFFIRVTLIKSDTRVVRTNISLEKGVLDAIDESANSRGMTRSAFLARSAIKEIERTG